MTRGSPTQRTSGIAASLLSLTLQPENDSTTPASSHSSPDGEADIAAHFGVSAAGRSSEQPSGIPNVGRFSAPAFHQRIAPNPALDNSEQFDDAPYVPPRATQAESLAYPGLDPRASDVYLSNRDIRHPFPHEGGASPSESSHSWGASSSSSTSSQQHLHDYTVESHHHATYYPAYDGEHRLGLEYIRYGKHPSNAGGSYYRTPPPSQDYFIDGLLSPEVFNDATTRAAIPRQVDFPISSPSIPATSLNQPSDFSAFSVSSAPIADSGRSIFPDAGPYLRQQLALQTHEPVNLYSLPDPPPGEKPSTPLPMLIKLAIYGSAGKQLTLQEIYTELENRFQWFRDHKHEKAWKNSIRHNLSLNKVFRHVPRPITEPGKGSYWQLDVSGGEGYKRSRKRRQKNRAIASEEEDEVTSEMDEDRRSPLDSSQHSAIDDTQIDPEIRNEGHVVGEGRAHSTTRRAGGGSPYPSQSPRYRQGQLPVAPEQDTNTPGQHAIRFGQPSFGYPQTRPMSAAPSSLSFAAMSSSMPSSTSMVTRPQVQYMASYDRDVPTAQPTPQSGIECVIDAELPTAWRVKAHPESEGQTQGNTQHSPVRSSSSGSSRTCNDGLS